MKLDTQMRIAANLRTLRTSKRLSQAEIASFIGTSRSLYTHYELGKRAQDAEALYIISTHLGIDMTAFSENDPQRFLGYIANHTYQDDLSSRSSITFTGGCLRFPKVCSSKSSQSFGKRKGERKKSETYHRYKGLIL